MSVRKMPNYMVRMGKYPVSYADVRYWLPYWQSDWKKKWADPTGNCLKRRPLRKQGAPAPNEDTVLVLAYTSQHEPRNFQSSTYQRGENDEEGREISGFRTLESELGRLKLAVYDC